MRYRDLPADATQGNPAHAWGPKKTLGSYWTIRANVPLADLEALRPVAKSLDRLQHVAEVRKTGSLPPIRIAVNPDGSAWIVDGNHRLIDARKAKLGAISTRFTFVGR